MGFVFFFQAEDGMRGKLVTGVQTCALPISPGPAVPNCWMMYWLPEVASPIGSHRHGGGATEMGSCAEPAPTSPFSVIRLLSRIEQSLPLQPTPEPALAGAAAASGASSPAMITPAIATRRIMACTPSPADSKQPDKPRPRAIGHCGLGPAHLYCGSTAGWAVAEQK